MLAVIGSEDIRDDDDTACRELIKPLAFCVDSIRERVCGGRATATHRREKAVLAKSSLIEFLVFCIRDS